MTRAAAIAAAKTYFDEGGFAADLARRVAIPTESQVEGSGPVLQAYLGDEIATTLKRLGFESRIFDNPVRGGPILIAERRENDAATTVLGYGHGDVIRGLEPQWREGLSPWKVDPAGRPALWPRHRRQQGPALDQPCRDGMRAEDARNARLQLEVAVGDRRGDRLARLARNLPRTRRRGSPPTC